MQDVFGNFPILDIYKRCDYKFAFGLSVSPMFMWKLGPQSDDAHR
jgi:hypothetical protein